GDPTAFVTKLDSSGSTVLYTAYLGGAGIDEVNGLAVDASGQVVLAGDTTSTDFPVYQAYQDTVSGTGSHPFVAKLTSSAAGLVFSTYLGGSGDGAALAVALDGDGDPVVTGYTASSTLATVNAAQPAYGGG